ncbi:MAG: Ig-like domain-containing protein, partial [Spirochaetota bacterium]|nr:Ig-like domain-containing protein [Spirochaetota bacterium]
MKKLLYLFSLILLVLSSGTCDEDPFLWDATSRTYEYVTVESSVPSISAVDVVKNTRFIFQFSQQMDKSSFKQSDLTLSAATGNVSSSLYTVSWQMNDTTLVLTPSGIPLASDTIYSLKLSGGNLRSKTGNPMNGDFSSAFTTSNIADTVAPSLSSYCVVSGTSCLAASG